MICANGSPRRIRWPRCTWWATSAFPTSAAAGKTSGAEQAWEDILVAQAHHDDEDARLARWLLPALRMHRARDLPQRDAECLLVAIDEDAARALDGMDSEEQPHGFARWIGFRLARIGRLSGANRLFASRDLLARLAHDPRCDHPLALDACIDVQLAWASWLLGAAAAARLDEAERYCDRLAAIGPDAAKRALRRRGETWLHRANTRKPAERLPDLERAQSLLDDAHARRAEAETALLVARTAQQRARLLVAEEAAAACSHALLHAFLAEHDPAWRVDALACRLDIQLTYEALPEHAVQASVTAALGRSLEAAGPVPAVRAHRRRRSTVARRRPRRRRRVVRSHLSHGCPRRPCRPALAGRLPPLGRRPRTMTPARSRSRFASWPSPVPPSESKRAPMSMKHATNDPILPFWQTRYGLATAVTVNNAVARSLQLYGEWAEHEAMLLSGLIEEGQTMLEFGGDFAAHALWMAQAVGPLGQVHVAEPRRIHFQQVCANVAINGLDNVFTHAVWLGRGKGSSSLGSLVPGTRKDADEKVRMATIDSLRLDALHLLKVNQPNALADVPRGRHRDAAHASPADLCTPFRHGHRRGGSRGDQGAGLPRVVARALPVQRG